MPDSVKIPRTGAEPIAATVEKAPTSRFTLVGLQIRWLGPVLTALALTLILITLPRLPLGSDDDSSWSAVIDSAHQKGWQFGTDIAFTYGPLGFLITPYFSPSSPWLRPAIDAALTFTIVVGFCLLAWRMTALWRTLTILSFAFLSANADPRNELLLGVGLLCWGFLCLLESGPKQRVSLVVFGGLAVFSILAKMTLLFPAVLGLGAVATCVYLTGQPRLAVGLLLGSAACFLLAWLGLGQSLLNLGVFFLNGLRIAAVYDQTMWADPFPVLKWPALAMLALTLSIVLLRFKPEKKGSETKLYRAALLIWLIGFLFVIWKHGFVRAGRDHLVVFFGFVPTLAQLMDAWPTAERGRRRLLRGLAWLCCLISIFSLQWLFAGDLKACLARPFRLAALHATNLLKPVAYQKQMEELQRAERDANQLPRLRSTIGKRSVDVFGCNQAYAVFNGLNFHPRPVFQSYAAYSGPLMSLNEQFYYSPKAPEYVLFTLNPIDERFPPLEDAFLFRDLLMNYRPVDAEGPFLLLQAKPSVAPKLTLLREGTLGQGDVIGLKEYGNSQLWLEITLDPNLLGYAARFLYRPPEVTLAVWCETPTVRVARFHAPAPMLAAGFLASPLPLDNGDFMDLYTGKPITRPSAYSIELSPAAQHFWSDAIHFRLYQLENQLGNSSSRDLLRLVDFPGFGLAPQEIVAAKHTMITVAGKPALYLPPGGYMRFEAPAGTKVVEGSFGFAPLAYLLGGATEGAEFRIEQEQSGGKSQVLYSQTLRPGSNPADRGMKNFSVALPTGSRRRIVFRTTPLAQGSSPRDLTCWADVNFK